MLKIIVVGLVVVLVPVSTMGKPVLDTSHRHEETFRFLARAQRSRSHQKTEQPHWKNRRLEKAGRRPR